MLVGLLLRGLGPWLQEHVGVDINQSDYEVEWVSSSHVLVRLRDVAFGPTLWRFAVGPTLPLTIHAGKARHVSVEISTEDVSVVASGVSVQLKEVPLSCWPKEAETIRAKLLKDKETTLSSRRQHEGDLKKWVKAKMRASVSSLQVVFQSQACNTARNCAGTGTPNGDGQGSMLTLAALMSSVDVINTRPSEMNALDQRGSEATLLVSKTCIANDVRMFLMDARRSLPADWCDGADPHSWFTSGEGEDVAEPNYVVCSPLQIRVGYRAWSPDALQQLPEAAAGAKKTLVVHAGAMRTAESGEANAAAFHDGPIDVRLDGRGFGLLIAFAGGFDSLFNAWLAMLSASTADVNAKPTLEEASQYMSLWGEGSRVHAGRGRQDTLEELESRLSGAFLQRLRQLSKRLPDLENRAVGSESGCAASSECMTSLCQGAGSDLFADSGIRLAAVEISPRIPTEAYSSLAALAALPLNEFDDDGHALHIPSEFAEAAPVANPEKGLNTLVEEFAAEAAYRCGVSDLRVNIDFSRVAMFQEDRSSRSRVDQSDHSADVDGAMLVIQASRLGMTYARNLDCKYISMEASHMMVGTPSRNLLDWTETHLSIDAFGDRCREMAARGRLSIELPTVWPYLKQFPGLRPTIPLCEAVKRWYVDEALPDSTKELLESDKKLAVTSAYVMGFSELTVTLQPTIRAGQIRGYGAEWLPGLRMYGVDVDFHRDLSGGITARLGQGRVLCSGRGVGLPRLETPVLEFGTVEVNSEASETLAFPMPSTGGSLSPSRRLPASKTIKRGPSSPPSPSDIVLRPLAAQPVSPLHVSLSWTRVNLTPLLLHTAISHHSAYDLALPFRVGGVASSEGSSDASTSGTSRRSVVMSVADASVRFWASGIVGTPNSPVDRGNHSSSSRKGSEQGLEPQDVLRCQIFGARFGYRQGESLEAEAYGGVASSSSIQVEVSALLADGLASGGTRGVFVCSSLDDRDSAAHRGEPATVKPRQAFAASASWGETHAEARVSSTSLHVAPTPELARDLRLLVPGLFARKKDAPQHDAGTQCRLKSGMGIASQARQDGPGDESGDQPHPLGSLATRKIGLVVGNVSVGLHLVPTGSGPALVGVPDLEALCCARPAVSRLSVMAGLQTFDLSSRGGKSGHELEVALGRAEVSVLQTFTQTQHASQAWAAASEGASGAVVFRQFVHPALPEPFSRIKAAALRMNGVSIWTSKAAAEKAAVFSDAAGVGATGPGISAPPSVRGYHGELESLLRPRAVMYTQDACTCDKDRQAGSESWLSLSIGGAIVEPSPEVSEKQAEGFYALEPRFFNGSPVYRKPLKALYLYQGWGGDWVVSEQISEPGGGPCALSPQSSWQGSDAACRPRRVAEVDHERDGITVVVTLEPTLLSLRRLDVRPLRQLMRSVATLGKGFQAKMGAEKGIVSREVRSSRMPSAATLRTPRSSILFPKDSSTPNLRWRFAIGIVVDVELPEHHKRPTLRLRCTPEVEATVDRQCQPAKSYLVEFKEIAIELLGRPAQVDRVSLSRSLTADPARAALQVQLCMSLRDVSVQVVVSPRLLVQVRVVTVRGEHRTGAGDWRLFFRPPAGACNFHVVIHYEQRRQLLLQIAPLAILLQHEWMQHVSSFVAGLRSWKTSFSDALADPVVEFVKEAGTLSGGIRSSDFTESVGLVDHEHVWEGPAWLLPAEGTAMGSDGRCIPWVPRRVWLHRQADGTLYDSMDPNRKRIFSQHAALSSYLQYRRAASSSTVERFDVFPYWLQTAAPQRKDSAPQAADVSADLRDPTGREVEFASVAMDSAADFDNVSRGLGLADAAAMHPMDSVSTGRSLHTTQTAPHAALTMSLTPTAGTRGACLMPEMGRANSSPDSVVPANRLSPPSPSPSRFVSGRSPRVGHVATQSVRTLGAAAGAAAAGVSAKISPLLTPVVSAARRFGVGSFKGAQPQAHPNMSMSSVGFSTIDAFANDGGEDFQVDIGLKGLQFWVPEASAAAEEDEDAVRSVGLLLAVEAHGIYGGNMKIQVPLLKIVRASSGSWQPAAADSYGFEPGLQASFASLLHPTAWNAESRSLPPTSPAVPGGSPVRTGLSRTPDFGVLSVGGTLAAGANVMGGSSLAGSTPSPGKRSPQLQPHPSPPWPPGSAATPPSLGATHGDGDVAAENVLVDIVALDVAVIGQRRIVGVRMDRVSVKITIDLFRTFGGIQSRLADMVALFRDTSNDSTGPSAKRAESEDAASAGVGKGAAEPTELALGHQISASDGEAGAGEGGSLSPDVSGVALAASLTSYQSDKAAGAGTLRRWLTRGATLLTQTVTEKSIGSKGASVLRQLSGPAIGKVLSNRPRPKSLDSEALEEAAAATSSAFPWRLELEVVSSIEVTLAGGLLAPAHWLVAEVSDILVWGPVYPEDNISLSGTYRCDVMCYDAAAAVLEPVLETVEVSVDVQRKGGAERRLVCKASTTRVNVNVQKALVDFFFAVNRGLQASTGTALTPIEVFEVINETGVPMKLFWRTDSDNYVRLQSGSSDWMTLKAYDAAAKISDPSCCNRIIGLHFELGEEHVDDVNVVLDHSQSRAYVLQSRGCPVIVEPENDLGVGRCKLRVLSAVTIHNHTAVPLSIMLYPGRSPGIRSAAEAVISSVRPQYDALESYKQRLCIGALQEVRVPLSWFSPDRQVTRIMPEVDSNSSERMPVEGQGVSAGSQSSENRCKLHGRFLPRSFTQLAGFLRVHDWNGEDDLDEPFGASGDGLYSSLTPGGGAKSGFAGAGPLGERMKFTLFFHRYMKLVGYVDAADVPVGGEQDDYQPRKSFTMHLGDVVSIRNMLPFPVILQLCTASGILDAHPLPEACAHEAFAMASQLCKDRVPDGAEAEMLEPFCFSLEGHADKPRLRVRSQLDNILQLTLGVKPTRCSRWRGSADMVASYVLGVDQEVSLPLAKRSLHLRLVALAERGPSMPSCGRPAGAENTDIEEMLPIAPKPPVCVSRSEDIYLPSANSHVPRNLPITLQRIDGGTPAEARSYRSSSTRMDVSIETTRNTLTLFAPIVVENLTPCTLRMHPEDEACLLGPMSRRLLPGALTSRDVAHIAVHDWGEDASQRRPKNKGQELREVSHLEVQRLQPMDVPKGCPLDCGFFQDQLSFGVCVRKGAPPLRLTKILSVFPCYVARSELAQEIKLVFCGTNGGIIEADGGKLSRGTKMTLHPPKEALSSSTQVPRIRIFEVDGGTCSDAFAIGQRGEDSDRREDLDRCTSFTWKRTNRSLIKEDSDRRLTFHVLMTEWRPGSQSRTLNEFTSLLIDKPRFVQVDIDQAVLQGKENVPFACGGHFITLRPQNFRNSGDALIHIQNRTLNTLYVHVSRPKAGDSSKATESSSQDIRCMNPGSQHWVHQAELDQETRYKVAVHICQHDNFQGQLGKVEIGSAITEAQHSAVLGFTIQSCLRLTKVKEPSDTEVFVIGEMNLISKGGYPGAPPSVIDQVAALRSNLMGKPEDVHQRCEVELVLEDRNNEPDGDPDVRVATCLTQSIGSDWDWLSNRWKLVLVDDQSPQYGQERLDWKWQVKAAKHLLFEAQFEVRHVEGSDGTQQFRIQSTQEEEAIADDIPKGNRSRAFTRAESVAEGKQVGQRAKPLSLMGWELSVTVPVVSVSWVHRHREVLALKVRGVEVNTSQERTGEYIAEFSAQHMQIDHFMESEMPVMLNRRFLHINSRWLGKKALTGKARWVLSSRIIHNIELELVPYWMNLEIGVLIRLWDLAEGSFSYLRGRCHRSEKVVPLEAPEPPRPGSEDKHVNELHRVWRLMRLAVLRFRLTVHVRSPDIEAVTDNPTARWIMRLPADMPNMDMILPATVLHDRYGSLLQLCGVLQEKYKRRMRYSFTFFIIFSYLAAILKALINAVMWLGRGPMDSITVAYQQSNDESCPGGRTSRHCLNFWWVSPLVHGTAEGTYRALAELIGNTAFGLVLFLNTLRHVTIGTARPRVQSILDGLAFGFRGLLMDTLITPFSQLWLQTQTAYQDWGPIRASLIFFLSVLRIPMGSVFGGLNLVACSLEGLANVLLHEEAQFANFEPQRTTEPVPLELVQFSKGWPGSHGPEAQDVAGPSEADGADAENGAEVEREGNEEKDHASWFKRLKTFALVMADDDEVMDMVQQRTQNVFNPGGT